MNRRCKTNCQDILHSYFLRLPLKERALFSQVIKDIYTLIKQSEAFDNETAACDNDMPSIIVKQIEKLYRDYNRKKTKVLKNPSCGT